MVLCGASPASRFWAVVSDSYGEDCNGVGMPSACQREAAGFRVEFNDGTDMLQSFDPVADSRSRVLVLGTMPGVMSLQKQQYYGHPRNAFWSLVAALAGEPLPEEYGLRKAMLLRAGIALWDVCRCCEREGSLDSNICREEPNEIVGLLADHPAIRAIAFNGQPAYRLFKRHVEKELKAWCIKRGHPGYPYLHLPSTSPAHAVPFERKLERWRPLEEYLRY